MYKPNGQNGPWSFAFAGTQLVLILLICLGIGYALDKKFGTFPWIMLGGGIVGIIGGLYNFIRESLGDGKK